jgi:hypothetical protein
VATIVGFAMVTMFQRRDPKRLDKRVQRRDPKRLDKRVHEW